MKPVCDTLHVARSNIAERCKAPCPKFKAGRKALPDDKLLVQIKAEIKLQPSYGYHRIWAILGRKAKLNGLPSPNHKRIYRVMKAHNLLLSRHAGGIEQHKHDGRIAVAQSNLRSPSCSNRWRTDGSLF